ncbi:ABC transporter permease subunit [Thermoanaerobacterium sp. CMT5567-10]|uniref:ABC transporter permease subunit n=1 Tax=Thermoanaerobacterium sp. CMT5567-10 TaxID=3061989 RepID=UPI0026DF8133|nr:ABC transporter permease subunit [Thermoanaerobacterium sp. CMT5567-10]WKV10144.1 ABC transporter permease subunit [Thermoanaerobacterium sp. CMT5567-10]
MNIYLRELKANGKSLFIWCIIMIAFVAASMGKYAASSYISGQSLNDIISKMPDAVKSMFGAGTFDLSKAIGFYGAMFIYVVLMAAIHASMIGANIISKEEDDKTAEFLMSKPVSRINVITSKLLASFTNIAIFNIVTLLSSLFLVNYYSKGENVTDDILKLMIGMFILQMIFMSIGIGLSALFKNSKLASPVTVGVMLVTYVLSLAIDIDSNLSGLKYFTPFKYFDAKSLIYGKGFEIIYIVLSILIISVFICVTYVFYKKRDLEI